MTNFKIRHGLYSELFKDGQLNKNLILENGCWYICTDTADLFLATYEEENLVLKQINAALLDKSLEEIRAEIADMSPDLLETLRTELYQQIPVAIHTTLNSIILHGGTATVDC
jgi:hypothetical protein